MKLMTGIAVSAGLLFAAPLAMAADEPTEDSLLNEEADESAVEEQAADPNKRVIKKKSETTVIEPAEEPSSEDTGAYGTEPAHPDEMSVPETDAPDVTVEPAEETPYMTRPRAAVEVDDDTMRREGPGFAVMAGGGIFGFADSTARDATTDIGGSYTARVAVGTRTPVGMELGYIGTAQNINAPGIDNSARLMSNGVEGALRLNIGARMVQPYVVGGAAWKRYDVTNADFNTSAVADDDSVVEFPVGAGLDFRFSGLLIDLRGLYRFATDEELLGGQSLDNWDVGLKAGVEF